MNIIEMVTEDMMEAKLFESLKEHRIPDYFLYTGDEGAKNWLKLDSSKEFPVSRRLTALLRETLPAVISFIPRNACVVGIGTGNGEKECIILEELARRGFPSYFPVDVSSRLVNISLEAVQHLQIRETGIVGLFEEMDRWSNYWSSPALVCVLGNTFSNFDPGFFFETIGRNVRRQDLLLFDCHLLPDSGGMDMAKRRIERTFRSRRNTLFNLDPLFRRGIRPDDVEFRLDFFPVQTAAGTVYRTGKTVYIRNQCGASVGKHAVFFQAGDIIQLGFTNKYTRDQIEPLTNQYGFSILSLHVTADGENQLILARKAT